MKILSGKMVHTKCFVKLPNSGRLELSTSLSTVVMVFLVNTKTFVIRIIQLNSLFIDVMGPDEHHDHVNNSAYTNAIAQISLRIPSEVYTSYIANTDKRLNFPQPSQTWLDIANKMYIPFDSDLQYHPEFDEFNRCKVA